MFTAFVTVIHVITCLAIIIVILLQSGKGADLGAVFGGGASSTLFGSTGAATLLSKLTSAGAILFMITSLTLAFISMRGPSSGGLGLDQDSGVVLPNVPQEGTAGQPAAPADQGAQAAPSQDSSANPASPGAEGPAAAPAEPEAGGQSDEPSDNVPEDE